MKQGHWAAHASLKVGRHALAETPRDKEKDPIGEGAHSGHPTPGWRPARFCSPSPPTWGWPGPQKG
eukprot:10852624-Alexandrium_andersonii.AAC.1